MHNSTLFYSHLLTSVNPVLLRFALIGSSVYPKDLSLLSRFAALWNWKDPCRSGRTQRRAVRRSGQATKRNLLNEIRATLFSTESEKKILPTLKLDEKEEIWYQGHSNWAICIPLSYFCSEKFPTFSLSYWETNSYYPRGLIMGKGNSPNFKTE